MCLPSLTFNNQTKSKKPAQYVQKVWSLLCMLEQCSRQLVTEEREAAELQQEDESTEGRLITLEGKF